MVNSPTLIDKKKFDEAILLHSEGNFGPAQEIYADLVTKYPNNPDINNCYGALFLQRGEPDRALAYFENAIRNKPNEADLYFNLAKAHADANQIDLAMDAYKKALHINPQHDRANYNLANIYKFLKDFDKALHYYHRDLEIEPKHDTYTALGEISVDQDNYQTALELFEKALALKPNSPIIKGKIAAVLFHLVSRAECLDVQVQHRALNLLKQAISKSNGREKVPLIVLEGDIYYLYGQMHEAIACYRNALEIDPDWADCRTNLGCALLTTKNFKEGWLHCQWRFNVTSYDVGAVSNQIASCTKPMWQGKVEPGKHLLITSEQGVGDQILHAQHVSGLLRRGMNITLTCAPKLLGLMTRSLPQATLLPDCIPLSDAENERIDYQVNAINLSRYLLDDYSKIKAESYLQPDPKLVNHFRDKYKCFGSKLKIGIAWRSNSQSCGARKTIPLKYWHSLLSNTDAQFISIQYRARDDDDVGLTENSPYADLYVDDEFDPYEDIEKAIAQIKSLDLIISVSNVAVHLAGQVNVPCWVLLAESALWHWFQDSATSPWYPSVRLFRREIGQTWHQLMETISQQMVLQFAEANEPRKIAR